MSRKQDSFVHATFAVNWELVPPHAMRGGWAWRRRTLKPFFVCLTSRFPRRARKLTLKQRGELSVEIPGSVVVASISSRSKTLINIVLSASLMLAPVR